MPRAVEGGVVDGKQLQHVLTRGTEPIDECGKVAEVAYTGTALAAKGKHRHHRACIARM